jgi:HNH endonuclease
MIGRKHTDETVRFWKKVDKRGPNECWPWLAGVNNKGYGTFRDAGAPRGWKASAPNVAFRLTYGRKPKEIDHTCCNTLCCNPAHLEDVTHSENMRRIWQRGRGNWGYLTGTKNGRSKLTREQVEAIKKDPRPSRAIAGEYKINKSTVLRVKSGLSYKTDAAHRAIS